MLIFPLDRFTVTYPPSSIAYLQTVSNAQSLVNSPNLSPSYAGLLYFPANPRNCSDPSLVNNGIPPDGITIDKLPLGFNLIAMIPISTCTADYLMQAKRDQAEAGVLYNYSTTTDMPTSSLSNTFSAFSSPLYGIAASDAQPILTNMVNYAGNMSSVPLGPNLSAIYDPTDYVRLTLTIDTGQSSSLPGLWLFLLVILAALGLIIASTSVSMHVSQYRARRDLRRRIAAGEIDLESLGIKRLTVPKEMIDAMPIKIFGASSMLPTVTRHVAAEQKSVSSPTHSASPSTATASGENKVSSESIARDNLDSVRNPPTVGFEQSSCCAICLDDYVVNTTPVRHLPCNHIFHPHCIDPFLQTRSSLCPLCKRSVLPKGFIPPTLQLTNATVARERRIRLMRERSSNHPTPSNLEGGIEMTTPSVNTGGDPGAPTQEEEDEELRRRPIGRRVLESVFPRFTRPVGSVVRSIRRASTVRP